MKTLWKRLLLSLCSIALLLTSAAALDVPQALQLLKDNYVNDLPPEVYEAKTVDEIFEILNDPYSYYMTAEEYQDFLDSVESESTFCGIGISYRCADDGIDVVSVLEGGGALDAGIKPGDVIIAIEGVSCVPGTEEVREKLLGEEGTSVTVTVLRDGKTADYRIERRMIHTTNTAVTAKDGVAMIACSSFGSETDLHFEDGVAAYKDDVHNWIIDLRGNPGGVTDSAIRSLGLFTGRATLLYCFGRGVNRYFTFYSEPAETDKPAIVLLDENTASASEIFASGIQGLRAGISVGSRTYGKGVAQAVIDENNCSLFDGDAIKLTTYRFYTAGGNTTDQIGVIPTLLIDPDAAEDVARLLCAEEPKNPQNMLRLQLNEKYYYVSLSAENLQNAAFTLLMEALPPDTQVWLAENGEWQRTLFSDLPYDGIGSRFLGGLEDCGDARDINVLAVYGILLGDENGIFHPEATLTRAEFCAMLAQAMDLTTDAPSPYSDVSDDSWYAAPITAMSDLGFFNGTPEGTFEPDRPVTYAEMVASLGRMVRFLNCDALRYSDRLDPDKIPMFFPTLPEWAHESAAYLTLSILNEDDAPINMLCVNPVSIPAAKAVSRAEAAATLYRVLMTLGILKY